MDWSEIELPDVEDPYRSPSDKGWDIINASELTDNFTLEVDVVVVGSGAGGGTAAATLSAAGLKVAIVEEGPLKSSDQFNMIEREGFTDLYQEGGMRRTKDGGILLVQGKNVGGGTTVNWCSTFRTPDQTLKHWRDVYSLKDCSPEDMAPYYADMEARLNIAKWGVPPNNNNEILKRGAEALGHSWDIIPRNVSGCINIGYCGQGCPMNAKQSMLVTTVPDALDKGATLIHRVQVHKVEQQGEKVTGILGYALSSDGSRRTGPKISIKARHTILAGGAVNTPGILLRSKVPDPFGRVGKRTTLHPVAISIARFDEKIDPFYGAPQSIYSDEFTWKSGVDGPMGFKMEVIPLLPGTFSAVLSGHGTILSEAMQKLSYSNGVMSFLRDGFHEESQGGSVELTEHGSPVLDYPITPYIKAGIKRSLLAMMEVQFAAGAKTVRPSHIDASWHTGLQSAKAELDTLSFDPGKIGLSSAHAMGGCAMGEDDKVCVVDSLGRYRHLDGLSIVDGSIFPTGLGANPQMSIFGFARKFATALGSELTNE